MMKITPFAYSYQNRTVTLDIPKRPYDILVVYDRPSGHYLLFLKSSSTYNLRATDIDITKLSAWCSFGRTVAFVDSCIGQTLNIPL